MKNRWQLLPGMLLLALGAAPLVGQVVIPHSFQPGDTARSAEVNANFQALKEALEALQSAHDSVLARVETLEAELSDVAANNALALHDHVAVVPDPNITSAYVVRFAGVNVQIVNGVDQETPNGTGNLIVGYNAARDSGWPGCSNGDFTDSLTCTNSGHVWSLNHKSGSHNIIVGNRNAYSQTSGLVAGHQNLINRHYATVTGGVGNTAEGFASNVSGGQGNQALADYSSISGGWNNGAYGDHSGVSGGRNNGTLGTYSSILGGSGQIATDQDQTIP